VQIIVEVEVEAGVYASEQHQSRISAPGQCPNCGVGRSLEAHELENKDGKVLLLRDLSFQSEPRLMSDGVRTIFQFSSVKAKPLISAKFQKANAANSSKEKITKSIGVSLTRTNSADRRKKSI
jgi:hypothetical protein